jgi:hypothetical protein
MTPTEMLKKHFQTLLQSHDPRDLDLAAAQLAALEQARRSRRWDEDGEDAEPSADLAQLLTAIRGRATPGTAQWHAHRLLPVSRERPA